MIAAQRHAALFASIPVFLGTILSGHYAHPCTDVDSFSALGPPRDQGGTAWCFANSAADLITAATGTRVATFDVALNLFFGSTDSLRRTANPDLQRHLQTSRFFSQRLPEARRSPREFSRALHRTRGIVNIGGEDDDAITMANARGLCPEQQFLANQTRPSQAGARQVAAHLNEIWRLYQSNPHPNPNDPNCPSRTRSPDDPTALQPVMRASLDQWLNQRCGPRVPLRQALIPVARREANSVEEFFRRHPTPQARNQAMSRLWAEIDSTLSSGRPISIGFNANDLHANSNINSRDADHSAVIAARRQRNGQCEYFVRNHYGSECGYREGMLCDPERGGVWIRREHLRTLYGTVAIAP